MDQEYTALQQEQEEKTKKKKEKEVDEEKTKIIFCPCESCDWLPLLGKIRKCLQEMQRLYRSV